MIQKQFFIGFQFQELFTPFKKFALSGVRGLGEILFLGSRLPFFSFLAMRAQKTTRRLENGHMISTIFYNFTLPFPKRGDGACIKIFFRRVTFESSFLLIKDEQDHAAKASK